MRNPLTNKRKRAIVVYVIERGDKYGNFVHLLIEDTLKAERMKADDLYLWLEKRGYRWKRGYWSKIK